ncbi:uncharacterized protein JCM15063_000923 [Sporobolomyces koalae]|uniref:uncharacterized protein n=1 Tax=Sporobolomyces koalae TaxID=500713 RepID=UPI00317E0C27
MLKGFFGGVSQPQDQTTPKASEQRNPFDLLSSITPSRRASQATGTQPPPTPGQSGLKTPTLQPRVSYSSPNTPGGGSDGGLTTPGASVPGTPGGRALPTTGTLTPLSAARHRIGIAATARCEVRGGRSFPHLAPS